MWTRFCHLIGKDEWTQDPRLANGHLRIINRELWEPALKEWFEIKATDEVVKLFLDQGFPIAPVMNIKEIFVGEHMNLRKMLIEVDHPEIGKICSLYVFLPY